MRPGNRWDFDYKKISLSAARQASRVTIMVAPHEIEGRQMFSSSRCHPPNPLSFAAAKGNAFRVCASTLE